MPLSQIDSQPSQLMEIEDVNLSQELATPAAGEAIGGSGGSDVAAIAATIAANDVSCNESLSGAPNETNLSDGDFSVEEPDYWGVDCVLDSGGDHCSELGEVGAEPASTCFILGFDSLGWNTQRSTELMQNYLLDLVNSTLPPEDRYADLAGNVACRQVDVPSQENLFDCGLHTLEYASKVASRVREDGPAILQRLDSHEDGNLSFSALFHAPGNSVEEIAAKRIEYAQWLSSKHAVKSNFWCSRLTEGAAIPTPEQIRSESPSPKIICSVPGASSREQIPLTELELSMLSLHKGDANANWLNDVLVNALLYRLQTPVSSGGFGTIGERVCIVNSYFAAKFKRKGWRGVRKWLTPVKALDCDALLVPMNINNTHWRLIAILNPQALLSLLGHHSDSDGESGDEDDCEHAFSLITEDEGDGDGASASPPKSTTERASEAPPPKHASEAPPTKQASDAPPPKQASDAPPPKQASDAPPPKQFNPRWNATAEEASRKKPVGRPPNSVEGRQWQFQSSWKEVLPWLQLSTHGRMFCSLCVSKGCQNAFAKRKDKDGNDFVGTADLLKRSVEEHARRFHAEDLAKVARPSPVVAGFAAQLAEQRAQLLVLMREVYYLTRERSPLAHFEDLCHLSELQGLDVGAAYRNSKAAHDFATSLCAAVLSTWLPVAQASPVISIMIDESTSVSSQGMLIVYLKFLRCGVPEVRFWRIVEVNDPSAAGIMAALTAAFQEDDIPMQRVVCMASDGASTMLGASSGVAARIAMNWCGFLLVCHCIAHRGALCASDAAKGNVAAEWFDSALKDILNYFKNSNERKSDLALLQDQLGVRELAMLKLHQVRWLSRAACTARLLHNYTPLVVEFRTDADANAPKAPSKTNSALNTTGSAGALWAIMVSHAFVVCLCAFCDILQVMALVSRLFQVQKVTYSRARETVRAARQSLSKAYTRGRFGGKSSAELHTALDKRSTVGGVYRFRGVAVTYEESEHTSCTECIRAYVVSLLQALDERFPDDAVFTALEIFDPTLLPPTKSEWLRMRRYQAAAVDTLVQRYGRPVNCGGKTWPALIRGAHFEQEWAVLSEQLADAWYVYLSKEPYSLSREQREEARRGFVDTFYADILTGSTFQEASVLIAIWRVECLSSVDCERGFSLMALIKTKMRNRMNVSTLDTLMQIAANAPAMADHNAVNELVELAVDLWLAACRRNVRKSHPGVAGRKPKAEDRSFGAAMDELASVGRQREEDEADIPLVVQAFRGDADLQPNSAGRGCMQCEEPSGPAPPTQEELHAAVGPFSPSDTQTVLPCPDRIQWESDVRAVPREPCSQSHMCLSVPTPPNPNPPPHLANGRLLQLSRASLHMQELSRWPTNSTTAGVLAPINRSIGGQMLHAATNTRSTSRATTRVCINLPAAFSHIAETVH
jgi:hypothetical protein